MTGWFGKHPAHGDFVSRGVPDEVRQRMQDWLDGGLATIRDGVGDRWEATFDVAPAMRFWIGSAVLPGCWAGVMVPSHDRVGRRYPLVLLTGGPEMPPPLEPSQDIHDALEDQAWTLRETTPAQAADHEPEAPVVTDLLWAVNEAGSTETLLSDIAAEDLRRAAQARSYWWVAGGDGPARVVSVRGWPDGPALGWLMVGDAVARMGEMADEQG